MYVLFLFFVVIVVFVFFFFFQAEDGIRDRDVTGVQTCALPIFRRVATGGLLATTVVFAAAVVAGSGVAAATAKPVNTSPPTISGPAVQEGKWLTGIRGTWSNTPTRYDYSWLRCDKNGGSCASIIGATGTAYRLTSADVGNTLRFMVTATNSDGSAAATSAATAVVTGATAKPVNTSPPTI